MKNVIHLLLILATFQITFPAQAFTGKYYREVQLGVIDAINIKQNTIVIRGMSYPLHKKVRVHDKGLQFPRLKHLYKHQLVKFKTIKNRKNNRVEIREIWAVPR